jgi:hypothetical protein
MARALIEFIETRHHVPQQSPGNKKAALVGRLLKQNGELNRRL